MKMRHTKGIGLIEVVIGSAIILVGVLALIASYNTFVAYAFQNGRNIQAALLLEEGFEAVKFMRDSGWDTNIGALSPGTTYYLYFDGTKWTSTTTAQAYVDGVFLRTFTVSTVYRDAGNDIAGSGTADSNTKKLTVDVAYRTSSGTTTRSVSTYLTNLFGN